jgi:energy-coupling factor transporter ATP-binding protein EcfA2
MKTDNYLIKKIKVKELFGLYDYQLPMEGELSNVAILYGDNGVGKSTMLQLAFHLLSVSDEGGHREYLYKSKFKSLEVELTDGIRINASFDVKLNKKNLVLRIFLGTKLLASWDYFPELNQREFFYPDDIGIEEYEFQKYLSIDPLLPTSRRVTKGKNIYLSTLRRFVPITFILNADRKLDSDYVSDPGDEVELRRKLNIRGNKDINHLAARSRQIAVSQALNKARSWIYTKAVQGTNQGSENVHSVYSTVLKHLVSSEERRSILYSPSDKITLLDKLDDIQKKTENLARYELATALDISDFKDILSINDNSTYALSVGLLNPYIQSLESRLAAVDSIYHILNKFITLINSLLTDKEIGFRLSYGFYIKNRLGEDLDTNQLSSGEQQLLLLLSYVIVARDQPSVFMIDEPEISLNIKWQRKFVNILLDITEGANIQFIFASHSMELISQHRDRVVVMESENE